ncbi:MAG: hypothetical protein J6Y08_04025 [Clostridiales bacterium]|nr:hypothetical protein [Clostridiales bacterium]
MTKESKYSGFSRGQWAFVFTCEAILVAVLLGLIIFFSVPAERKLMDTVRKQFHAKQVNSMLELAEEENAFLVVNNLQERRKVDEDVRAEDLDEGTHSFYFRNVKRDDSGSTVWVLDITSVHFDSHNHAREIFYQTECATDLLPNGEYYPHGTKTYSDARVLEVECIAAVGITGATDYDYYIMYLEGKSIVTIKFSFKGEPDEASRKQLTDLCYALSIPDPQNACD